MLRSHSSTPWALVLTVVLLSSAAVSNSANTTELPPAGADVNDWDSFLEVVCGVTELPEPGSQAQFMGQPRRVNTSQTSYEYYRFGNASSGRPPLVLINGLASTMHDWAPTTLKELARWQEVLVYDNPGEGAAKDADPESNLTVFSMAEDALELFSALGLEKPNVLGLSMGGQIAITLAATAGDQIGKVVLAPGNAGSPNSHMPDSAAWQRIANGTIDFLGFVGALFPLDTEEGRAAACSYGLDKAGGVVDPPNPTAFLRHVESITDFIEGPGVWDLLPNITNPVLLLGGAKDPLMPTKDMLDMVPRLSNPWLAVYPSAMHGVLMQESASILPLLDNFLKSA